MRIIKKGATSQSLYFEVLDSTSTTGGRKTGLVYNTASLTAYYTRNRGLATAITLATLAAADSAFSSGGFKEVDATNSPGLYRLDVPDAAFATGADSVVVTIKGATGMAQSDVEVQLVAADLQDATSLGVSRIDAAISSRSSHSAADVWSSATRTLTDFSSSFKTGYALSAAGVQAIWDALTSALTTAGSVGKLLVDNINATISSRSSHSATDVWAAATRSLTDKADFALSAASRAAIADDTWDEARAGHVAAGSFGEGVASVQGNVTGSVASVTGAVGSVSGNVGGNVAGSVGSVTTVNDKTGYRLSATGVNDILRTALTEGYAADNAAPTLEQFAFMLWSVFAQFDITGTTITARRLDGTTSAMTFTLDSSTAPTSRTRAT